MNMLPQFFDTGNPHLIILLRSKQHTVTSLKRMPIPHIKIIAVLMSQREGRYRLTKLKTEKVGRNSRKRIARTETCNTDIGLPSHLEQ